MARKSTPDIMSSLMGSDYSQQERNKAVEPVSNKEDYPQTSKQASQEESNKEIKQSNNTAVNTASNTARSTMAHTASIHTLSGGLSEGENIAYTKATFNLSNETLDILEEVWFSLRKKLRSKRITKTAIVEAAIELALAEYEQKGEKAKLFKKLDN